MQDLFEMDWSFVLVLVSVTLLMLTLGVRSRLVKRRRKRDEKLQAKRAYKDWLASSHMQLLEIDSANDEQTSDRR